MVSLPGQVQRERCWQNTEMRELKRKLMRELKKRVSTCLWGAVMVIATGAATTLPAYAEVALGDAWVRALPPTQSNTAAYLTVHNSGPDTVRVVGASAEPAGRVEIHHSTEVDGYMRMQPVEALSIAPGESVQLAPGGVHLMLLDLARMPAEGETVELCLVLESGQETCTQAPVRRDGAGGGDHSHHHSDQQNQSRK